MKQRKGWKKRKKKEEELIIRQRGSNISDQKQLRQFDGRKNMDSN